MKEESNKQADIVLLKKLSDLLKICEDIKQTETLNGTKLKRIDNEIQDWFMLIQKGNLTPTESSNVTSRLKELQMVRKALRNEFAILNIYKNNCNIDCDSLHKALEEYLKKPKKNYEYKVIDTETIKEVLNKKQGIPEVTSQQEEKGKKETTRHISKATMATRKIEKYPFDKMLELYQNGKSYKEISNIVGCSYSTVVASFSRHKREQSVEKND